MTNIAMLPPASPDVVGWIALAVAGFTLVWTIYWERTSTRRRLIDEYWYRQVVGPNCVSPIVEFLNKWIDEAVRNGANPPAQDFDAMYTAFCGDKESLLSKLWLSRLFSDTFYEEAEEALDGVEDVFAQEMAKSYAHAAKPSIGPGNALVVRELLIDKATQLLVSAAAKQGDKLNGRLAKRS